MSKLSTRRGGFTLIELMIVVAIIGILAAIAIPNFMKFQLRAKSGEGKTNIAAIRVAQEGYTAEFGTYVLCPESPAGLNVPPTQKQDFVDQGDPAAGTGFRVIGWAPEGPVYFSYGVNYDTGTPSEYYISAHADIDGDLTLQGWGYVRTIPDPSTGDPSQGTIGSITEHATECSNATGVVNPATGNFDVVNQVGACGLTHGKDVF